MKFVQRNIVSAMVYINTKQADYQEAIIAAGIGHKRNGIALVIHSVRPKLEQSVETAQLSEQSPRA